MSPLRKRGAVAAFVLAAALVAGARAGPADLPSPIVGQVGGPASAVAVAGNVAYVGIGPRVVVFNVTSAAQPVEIGRTAPLASTVRHVAVAGATLFVAGRDLALYDVTDPRRPALIGRYDFNVGRVIVDSPYAYLLAGRYGFPLEYIADISDPRAVRRLALLPPSSPKEDLVVAGDVAYATYNYFLQVIDVRDPTRPAMINRLDLDTQGHNVAVAGDTLFVTTSDGLRLYDVGIAGAPREVGAMATGGVARGVAARGQFVFVAAADALQVIDIADRSRPGLVAQVAVPGAREVTLIADAAYVTGPRGLMVVDVTDPTAPRIAHEVPSWQAAFDVALTARGAGDPDLALVAAGESGLAVVDVAHAAAPTTLAAVAAGFSARRVAAAGDVAYVAGSGRVAAFDVTAPRAPVLLGVAATAGTAQDFAVQGDNVLVADGGAGLTVMDASDPAHLTATGSVTATGSYLVDVVVDGPHVFAADTGFGLRVVDAADPAAPRIVASVPYTTQWESRGLALGGDRLFAVASQVPIERMFEGEWPEDVLAVEVTDPRAPRAEGWLEVGAWPKGMATDAGRLYLVSGRDTGRDFGPFPSTVMVWRDVAAGPVGARQWSTKLPEVPQGVAAAGDHAYVADREAGLMVVDVSDEALDRPTPTPSPTPTRVPSATPRPGEVTATPLPTSTVLPSPTAEPPAPPRVYLPAVGNTGG